MILNRIDRISIGDITSLVDNAVRECKTLEYKEALPGRNDAEKKEFLADISSFANASGGSIVYGVSEVRDSERRPTGLPERAIGLANVNGDAEVRRLEEMIRDGLEPRISGVGIRSLDGFPNGPVLVVQIPKSWAAPHMVSFKASPRFFSRTNAGKSPLNVPEIRAAFLQSEEIPNRIRRFRESRLSAIVAGETPVVLPQTPLVVLHVVPVESYLGTESIDVLEFLDGRIVLPPMGATQWNQRLNFDGYVSYQGGSEQGDPQFNYTQLFRNGAIEGVDAFLLAGFDGKTDFIPSVALEEDVLNGAKQYFAAFKKMQMTGAVVIMLSLLNVRGFYMHASKHRMPYPVHRIEKRDLLLPDVMVDDVDTPVEVAFRPVFDLLWQACGYRCSLNYDEAGKRRKA